VDNFVHNCHLTRQSLDFMRVPTICTKGMQDFMTNEINDLEDSSDQAKNNCIYFLLDLTHFIFVNK
jgi:hypothetical protein